MSELIKRIANGQTQLGNNDVGLAEMAMFRQIGDTLAEGEHIEIRGSSSFCLRTRLPRIGSNPQTGARSRCLPGSRLALDRGSNCASGSTGERLSSGERQTTGLAIGG